MATTSAVVKDERISCEQSASVRSEMDYFHSRRSSEVIREWLREEVSAGRKAIGLPCWSVPAEIIIASGGVPVRLFGLREGEAASQSPSPRDICPLAASLLAEARALAQEGLLAAVALPATCDWKRKLGSLLGGVAVLALEPPFSGDSRFVNADLKGFARQVALATDLPVTAKNLSLASEKMARASETHVALQRLRQRPECLFSGASALAVEQAFMRDDLSRWTEHCSRLVRVLKEEPSSTGDRPGEQPVRILLFGSPVMWKEGSLVHLVEEAGGNVVCEDFHSRICLSYPDGTGTAVTGAAGSSLASRWTETCFCSPIAEGNESLLFRAIEDFGVDGVIGHVYRSCARVQMALPGILRRVRDRGIPAIAVETQGDPNEADRLRARIDPFLEMLLVGRRNRS